MGKESFLIKFVIQDERRKQSRRRVPRSSCNQVQGLVASRADSSCMRARAFLRLSDLIHMYVRIRTSAKGTNIKNGPPMKMQKGEKKKNRRCYGTDGTGRIDSRLAGINCLERAPPGHVLILMKRQGSSERRAMPKYEQTYFILNTERVQDLFSISPCWPLDSPLASSVCRVFTKSFLSWLLLSSRSAKSMNKKLQF